MEYKLKSFDTPLVVSKIANIHYFEFVNKYHTKEDFHNFCELLYVDRGSIIIHSENYSGTLSDNQLIIHRPNERHFLECSDNITPNVIIIGFECECSELEVFSHTPFTLSAEHKKMLSDIMMEGMNVYAPPYDLPNLPEMVKRTEYPFAADQLLKLYLEAFLITLVRACKKTQESPSDSTQSSGKISDIHQYICEHYTEKISLDNLCFLFGTNKTTLCHDFKTAYGITILNYINNLRIKEAKALLRKNELSVTEISEKLGFNSIHYFCKLFKKATNQSPKNYYRTIRSKLNI
ncbi:MAG: helix-turn-helix transcriptional regulator [Clostridia bacterium]|nr:helix-turn-helix transcriptional regulator [Clostridia bacterium]MBP3359593.1 helix-turn-helix transcriptional regulator [Clostridia bacterium]